MRQSSDTGHYFQTDSALSEEERRSRKSKNEAGSPVRLQSKLLAVIADSFNDDDVYVAEAAGTVKRVVLETGTVSHNLRPATSAPSPLTCLAIAHTTSTSGTLFAGSWDKTIYAWDLAAGLPTTATATAKLSGHTDFVKALLCSPPLPTASGERSALLVSASADKTIIVWHSHTRARLHTLTAHARGVLALALDPLSLPDPLAAAAREDGSVVLASGDSNREIRFWRVSTSHARELRAAEAASDGETAASAPRETEQQQEQENEPVAPLLAHETSVFALLYAADGDLWTASADRSAKQLARARRFTVDATLVHDDYVKAVVVAAAAEKGGAGSAGDGGAVVVTGCRDEHVRVWDATSGRCVAVLRGHWDEVTGLALVRRGQMVVSVSIDGTLRRWGLGQQDIDNAIAKYDQEDGEKAAKAGISLTEDEERELAELMDDDD